MARKLEKAALRAPLTMVDNWSDEARRHPVPPRSDRGGPKGSGPHFALTNALPTRTNIISRKRDVVVFRLALRDGHAETLPNDGICLFWVAWFEYCMAHVVLLGDSVFDNSAYVAGGPDVVRQLQARLPAGSRASLAACDGARIAMWRLRSTGLRPTRHISS